MALTWEERSSFRNMPLKEEASPHFNSLRSGRDAQLNLWSAFDPAGTEGKSEEGSSLASCPSLPDQDTGAASPTK